MSVKMNSLIALLHNPLPKHVYAGITRYYYITRILINYIIKQSIDCKYVIKERCNY